MVRGREWRILILEDYEPLQTAIGWIAKNYGEVVVAATPADAFRAVGNGELDVAIVDRRLDGQPDYPVSNAGLSFVQELLQISTHSPEVIMVNACPILALEDLTAAMPMRDILYLDQSCHLVHLAESIERAIAILEARRHCERSMKWMARAAIVGHPSAEWPLAVSAEHELQVWIAPEDAGGPRVLEGTLEDAPPIIRLPDPVTIVVIAESMQVATDDVQLLYLSPNHRSGTITYQLRPVRATEDTFLEIHFSYRNCLIARMTLRVSVTENGRSQPPDLDDDDETEFVLDGRPEGPDLMTISVQRSGDQHLAMAYIGHLQERGQFDSPGDSGWRNHATWLLQALLLYERALKNGAQPETAAEELVAAGQWAFEKLFWSDDFRTALFRKYETCRRGGQLPRIRVLGDYQNFPWELLHIGTALRDEAGVLRLDAFLGLAGIVEAPGAAPRSRHSKSVPCPKGIAVLAHEEFMPFVQRWEGGVLAPGVSDHLTIKTIDSHDDLRAFAGGRLVCLQLSCHYESRTGSLKMSRDLSMPANEFGRIVDCGDGAPDLLILNGCSTMESDVFDISGHMAACLEGGVRIVMGPRIPIYAAFASQFTAKIYRYMMAGNAVDASLYLARRECFERAGCGGILGLAYSWQGDGGLVMSWNGGKRDVGAEECRGMCCLLPMK